MFKYKPVLLIILVAQVARKRIRRKPGSKIELKSNPPSIPSDPMISPTEKTFTSMSPKGSRKSRLSGREPNHMSVRLTIRPSGQPTVSISDRSTSTTCTSSCTTTTTTTNNHSPPLPIPERPILIRSKSNLKTQSLNSKREKKAAKTLAIVTGNWYFLSLYGSKLLRTRRRLVILKPHIWH